MGYHLSDDQCEEPGCIRPPYEGDLCYAHYMLLSVVEKRVLGSLCSQPYVAPRTPVAETLLDKDLHEWMGC